jgi:putative flippase GtrA
LIRFGLVGLLNTAIDVGLYLGLRSAGMGLLPANAISTTAGLLVSFRANRSFTFRDRDGAGATRVAVLFFVTTALGLWVLQPLVIGGVEHLLATWDAVGRLVPGPLRNVVPKLAGIAVSVVWNYLAYDRVVFPGRGRGRALTETAEVPGIDQGEQPVDRYTTSDAA